MTKSFKTRLDESSQDASILGLGLGIALCMILLRGGGGFLEDLGNLGVGYGMVRMVLLCEYKFF